MMVNKSPEAQIFPGVGRFRRSFGQGRFSGAMELEADLPSTVDGSLINIVAKVDIKGPGFAVCTSKIFKQSFRADVKFDNFVEATFFQVQKISINGVIWLKRTDETVVLGHQPINPERFEKVVETCAGFSAVSQGYEQCGCKVDEVNEVNSRFADWRRQQGKTVIEGDISQSKTMIELSAFQIGILSGGISCQPWSALGDQRQLQDERSRSMTAMLMTIHFLQIPMSILECTPAVMTSEDAQVMLKDFAQKTGLVLHQKVLGLHHVWPAKRNRWWATLSHPSLQIRCFPGITPLAFEPAIVHLMPRFLELEGIDRESLKLDEHELQTFLTTKKGMFEHQVNPLKPLPTATHSWGSQLRACECGCRQRGSTQQRIETKGLYAQLLPLDEKCEVQGQTVNCMRHLHVSEVALVNGVHPFTKGFRDVPPRFALAGIGQIGSPFQSAWVLSHAFHDMFCAGLITKDLKPLQVMKRLASELFYARDLMFKNPPKTESMIRLEWAVHLWGNPEGDAIMKDYKNYQQWVRSQYPNEVLARTVLASLNPENDKVPDIGRSHKDGPHESSPHEKHDLSPSTAASVAPTVASGSRRVFVGTPEHVHSPHESIQAGTHPYASDHPRRADSHVGGLGVRPKIKPSVGPSVNANDSQKMSNPPKNMHVVRKAPVAHSTGVVSKPKPTCKPAVASSQHVMYESNHDQQDSEPSYHLGEHWEATAEEIPSAVSPRPEQVNLQAEGIDSTDNSQDFDKALIAKCEEIETVSRADQSESFQKGGVPGFSTGLAKVESQKRLHDQHDEIQKRPKLAKSESPDKEHVECVPCIGEQGSPSNIESEQAEKVPVFVLYGQSVPQLIHVDVGTSFGQIAVTCAKQANEPHAGAHHAINTAVGSQLSVASEVYPGAVVMVEKVSTIQRHGCQAHLPDGVQNFPNPGPCTREDMLWKQRGWVATDEMSFYVQTLGAYPAGIHPPIVHDDTLASKINLCQAILQLINLAKSTNKIQGAPILFNNHWFPIVARPEQERPEIVTTPMEKNMLQQCVRECIGPDAVSVQVQGIRQVFDADCGFQTLGWIINQIVEAQPSQAIQPEQACHWRMNFHAYLIGQNRHQEILTHPILLGGMTKVAEDLSKLVQQHGVSASRSVECADHLISVIGVNAIQRILAAPKAWADLKARASMCKPPIRIVNSQELQALINQKVTEGKPIGRKQNKVKGKVHDIPLRLKADQISVPHAVFKQKNGEEVGQIAPGQISPNSKGVIVVNIEEAIPYFTLKAPLSSEGLALLILDHHDMRIPTQSQMVKVPALSNATKEPIIASAAMLQIGTQEIVRNAPAEAIAVQETPHAVVRAATYRDQWPGNWDEVARGPVRKLMETPAMRKIPAHDILDIWDRQFLNDAIRKEEPANATIFMVNARIHHEYVDDLLQQSGSQGCFFEKRTADGRHPHDGQQVVWLPKKTFAEAVVAVQSNQAPCTLARSGQRYGIRVDHSVAEQTHAQHRPDVIFLNGHDLRKYKVGPLPYGSSKASIAALFKQWQWQARPVAPAGPARDKSGMIWRVQASSNPEHWIYQVSQGDVLITPELQTPVQSPAASDLIASEGTIQSLKNEKSQQPSSSAAGSDPWLHHDPWKPRASSDMPAHQYATMKSEIENNFAKNPP